MSGRLDPTPAQREILAAMRDVLTDRFPLARLRGLRDGNADGERLAEAAALGWMGMGLDAAAGGAEMPLIDEVLVFHAIGRHLVTPSVMAGALAAQLASACGDGELAQSIATGASRVCLGNRVGAGGSVALLDAADAGYALIWDETTITCRPLAAFGNLRPARAIDGTVALALAQEGTGGLSLSGREAVPLLRRAALLVAAQLLGLAEAATEATVDYAGLREQFRQPIGAFQAVKHRCADMRLRSTVLGATVRFAAIAVQEGAPDAALQVAAARLLAARYAVENAAACIQLHGATGFAAEGEAHRFLLRAHLLEHVGIPTARQEALLATLEI